MIPSVLDMKASLHNNSICYSIYTNINTCKPILYPLEHPYPVFLEWSEGKKNRLDLLLEQN